MDSLGRFPRRLREDAKARPLDPLGPNSSEEECSSVEELG